MAITINGTGNITGLTAGGLPDATITQAEIATGVAGTGPAFSAYRVGSGVALTNGSFTKVIINTKEYDTANCFNTSLSRFTPNVAGYYSVSGNILVQGTAGTLIVTLGMIFKNGLRHKDLSYFDGTQINGFMASGCCQVYLNGTTDYIELYVLASSTTSSATYNSDFQFTYFQASMVRAA